MSSKPKNVTGNILIAGVAIVIQDVSPDQISALKKGIEEFTGKSVQIQYLIPQKEETLPLSFESKIVSPDSESFILAAPTPTCNH